RSAPPLDRGPKRTKPPGGRAIGVLRRDMRRDQEAVSEMDNRDDTAAGRGRLTRGATGSGRSSGRSSRASRSASSRDRWGERGGEEPTWTGNAPQDWATGTMDRERVSPRGIAPDRWLDRRGRAGASARRASKDPAKGRGKRRRSWRVTAIIIGILVCLLAAG